MKTIFFGFCIVFLIACNHKENTQTTQNNSTSVTEISQNLKKPIDQKDQEDLAEKGFDLMNNESIGIIKFGMTANEIIEFLGKPEDISEPFYSEVDGETYQHFDYKKEGIFLSFVLKSDSTKEVRLIEIKPPCDLKTSRQIGIGSNSSEIINSYKEFINEEFSDSSEIVLGSIYGGIIFKIENQEVKSIYVGPSTE